MAKQKFKVTNWRNYNKALINHGSVTFWLDDEAIQPWYEPATHVAGMVLTIRGDVMTNFVARKSARSFLPRKGEATGLVSMQTAIVLLRIND